MNLTAANFDFDPPVIHFERNPHEQSRAANASPNAISEFMSKLPAGAQVLPRFAILSECSFFDEKKGRKVTIDEPRLSKIAGVLNEKFTRFGAPMPIAPGHTVDGLAEEQQPRIVGYGIHADVQDLTNPITGLQVTDDDGKPIKAIYVTPIALPGETDTFKRLNRRSPELWLDPDDIDPLSLLGSTTPRLANLGPHLFSRKGDSSSFDQTNEDEAMADKPKNDSAEDLDKANPVPSDDDDESGDDQMVAKVIAKLMQSDAWTQMEATTQRLGSLADMLEQQFGGGQAGQIPPAPDGGSAGQGHPDDDLFAEPAHGENEKPKKMGASEYCDPERMAAAFGPTNTFVPSYDTSREQFSRDFYQPTGAASVMDQESKVRFARLESELLDAKKREAEKDKRIKALEQDNLLKQVNEELIGLHNEGVLFDYDEEAPRLVKMARSADRASHYEYMRKHFKRKEDVAPGGGVAAVPIHMQRPIQFQKGLTQAVADTSRIPEGMVSAVAAEAARRQARGEQVTADQVWSDLAARSNGSANGMVQVR